MNDKIDLTERANALNDLLTSQKTLLLSTASVQSIPDLGYAPFVRDESGCFYIFVSDLASHTANLLTNPLAAVMFIRPESESRNKFARERAVFSCQVTEIARHEPQFDVQLKALHDKFGEMIPLLRTLSDFHLMALNPESGRYVAGFGQAFNIDVKKGTLSRVESTK